MAYFTRHEVPCRSFDGMTSVYCQSCGREICRRNNTQIRSVVKCAICVLKAEGVENPEDRVLPQYLMFDPMKPPIPIDAEGDGAIVNLFPEEKVEFGRIPSSGGIAGTAKALYRALGFGKPKPVHPPSQKTATKRRKDSSLFE